MFKTIIPLLQQANRVGIFTHQNPDGDAMGSQIGLKHLILHNFPRSLYGGR